MTSSHVPKVARFEHAWWKFPKSRHWECDNCNDKIDSCYNWSLVHQLLQGVRGYLCVDCASRRGLKLKLKNWSKREKYRCCECKSRFYHRWLFSSPLVSVPCHPFEWYWICAIVNPLDLLTLLFPVRLAELISDYHEWQTLVKKLSKREDSRLILEMRQKDGSVEWVRYSGKMSLEIQKSRSELLH